MLFNACSFQKSPTEVATSFIEALKAQDEETLAKVYSGDWSEDGGLTSTLNSTDLGGMSKETAEKFIAKVLEFDYTYGEETINDDKATVDVTITTYNFTSMLSDMLTDLYSKAIELAFSGLTEEELEKQINELTDKALSDGLDKLTEKNVSNTVKLELTKDGHSWKVDPVTDEFTDALLGGLNTFLESQE
jgi:hypothetical protein